MSNSFQWFVKWSRAVWQYVFSRDIFIAYSRRDHGSNYALAMARELQQKKFAVVMDTLESRPNPDPPEELLTKLDGCRQLIVVASPAAIRSKDVGLEVCRFPKDGRSIILIEFAIPVAEAGWYKECLPGLPPRNESDSPNEPRPETVQLVVDAFQYKRQEQRQRTAAVGAGLLTLALLSTSTLLGVFVTSQTKSLKDARAKLLTTNSELGTAQAKVNTTSEKLGTVQGELDTKNSQLTQANASLSSAQEEVKHQSQVALAKRLASESEAIRDRDGKSLQASVLLAVESLNIEHGREADQALRRALVSA